MFFDIFDTNSIYLNQLTCLVTATCDINTVSENWPQANQRAQHAVNPKVALHQQSACRTSNAPLSPAAAQSRTLTRKQTTARGSPHDALTGVFNARAYQAQSQALIQTGADAGRGYSVLFVDLDHFKRVNDQHGHAAGDKVLQVAARALQKGVRHNDVVGRIGGEEFGVLLPQTDLSQALRVAEHLRLSIEQLAIDVGGHSLQITASIGVAHSPDGRLDLPSLQQRADSAMYQAKAAGRNRVTSLP